MSNTNTNIKVAFVEVYNFLEENKNKKVSTILTELSVMMSKATTSAETTKYNDDGELTHIFCYYHKEWEAVAEVAYGPKKNTKSGLNTMCKVGVSNWTKQQRAKKKAEASLLGQLQAGEIQVEDLETLKKEILEASKVIIPLEVAE